MSSDVPRFLLSSLTLPDGPGRYRLHSRGFALYTRLSALLLLLGVAQIPRFDVPLATGICMALALFALACVVWFRSQPVFATRGGIEVGAGRKRRLIPWSRVIDVREVPWIRFSPPWYPKMWQVDLDGDERFDFCGTRKARQIVIEYVKRAERAEAHKLL